MNTPTLMQSEELRAPWNESETPMKKFEVTCSQSLSKTVLVMTDNYVSDTNWGEERSFTITTPTQSTDGLVAYYPFTVNT